MAAMVGTVPIGSALGAGAGMPAMHLLRGMVMLCFITGYAAMSRKIVNSGDARASSSTAYLRQCLRPVAGGRIDFGAMITRHLSLSEINEAIRQMGASEALRTVVDVVPQGRR
jgi:Zn-dependent alcohol dehydrogenase